MLWEQRVKRTHKIRFVPARSCTVNSLGGQEAVIGATLRRIHGSTFRAIAGEIGGTAGAAQ